MGQVDDCNAVQFSLQPLLGHAGGHLTTDQVQRITALDEPKIALDAVLALAIVAIVVDFAVDDPLAQEGRVWHVVGEEAIPAPDPSQVARYVTAEWVG